MKSGRHQSSQFSECRSISTAYAVHSAPAPILAVPSVTPSVSTSVAVSRTVASSKDPKTNDVTATSTFPVESPPARSSVSSSSSHVVDPAYAVKTPPVRQPMVPPERSSVIALSATLPITAPAKPSIPSQDAYAVKESPIHTAAAVDPVHTLAATASAKPSIPTEDSYPVEKSTLVSASAVEKSPLISASAVDAVQALPSETPSAALKASDAEGSECTQQCNVKCQTTNIAFDITQCQSSCLAACRGEGESSARGTANRHSASAVLGTKGKASHGLSLDSESVSYEECIESCKGNWQTAGIAFDVSQGKYDCASACARYASEDTKITLKKKTVPTVSPFRVPPPPPPTELSSETVTYESCMRACKGRWQSAGLALDISQGDYDCKSDCAQYASDDKKIVVKKATPPSLPASSFRLPVPKPDVKIASSEVTFESCMRACKGRWQSAGIAFDVSQGDYDCKSDCAQYAAEDEEVIIRKDTLPLSLSQLKRTTSPAPRPRLFSTRGLPPGRHAVSELPRFLSLPVNPHA